MNKGTQSFYEGMRVKCASTFIWDEELALSVNGKKRKIKKSDFVTAMQTSGLEEKVIENLFIKLLKAENK